MKQKEFTLKRSLNKWIGSSPSETSMRNSVLQALLTRICLINKFASLSVIWSNHNNSIMESNQHSLM